MAETKLNMQLLLRRDSTFTANYVLSAGEPGFEISTNTLKIGDGTSTWAQLPIANKAAIDTLIKVTDDKVEALSTAVSKLGDTYATDAEVEAVRKALADAKLDKTTYESYIATHAMTDEQITAALNNKLEASVYNTDKATFALKTAVEAVDAKFASYTTTANQEVIDAAQDAKIKAIADDYVKSAQIADFETKANVQKVADDLSSYKTSNNTAVAGKVNVSDYNTKVQALEEAIAGKQAAGSYAAEEHSHVVADITDFETVIAAKDYATKAEAQGYADAKDEAITAAQDAADAAQGAVDALGLYVGTIPVDTEGTPLAESVVAYINKKTDGIATSGNLEALGQRVTGVEGRVEAIEKDYLKAADKTELSGAIDLKADKATVEAMYTNSQIDGFLAGKVDSATYTEDKATFALKSEITSLTGKADKSYVDEELGKKVNVSDYNVDKATFALKTDLNDYRTSEAQDAIDEDFEGRIADLEAIDHDKLAADASAAAVATVLDGAPEKFNTLKEIAAWIAEADTAEDAASLVTRVAALEAIDHDAYVDADADLKEELEGKIAGINNHSHTFVESELNEIKAGDVAKWNAEIGAKELAGSKATMAEVEAKGYATVGQVATAKQEAIDDAAGKYETIGTAQGIVDGLKLGETYEPIGAEGRAKGYTDGLVNPLAERVKAIEDAPYTTKKYVDDQDAATLAAAKAYADGLNHKDTTYTVAATENALEFTVTPSEGEAQTVKLAAPVVDTGVMKVVAGTDVVVTPESGTGEVTVAHKVYGTGTYTKPDSVSDANFVTGVTVENGHVTGATVKSLAEALMGMTFVFDGGNSTNN
jgi:hypothetical protein